LTYYLTYQICRKSNDDNDLKHFELGIEVALYIVYDFRCCYYFCCVWNKNIGFEFRRDIKIEIW